MKKVNFFFLLLMIHCFCFAQTTISGGIYSNATWSPSGNPYIVTGNTVVFTGVHLTIEPGVIVKFNPSVGLEVRGKLTAIGNAVDSIIFTSNSPNPSTNGWNGITCIGTTYPLAVGDQLTMEYCRGEYAGSFVDLVYAHHGPYIFRHCTFAHCNTVNHDGGYSTIIFDHCRFEDNWLGLEHCQYGARVSNCDFVNNVNGLNGISEVYDCFFYGNTGVALSPLGITNGCTVENNNVGVRCPFNAANAVFTNNTIRNNAVGVEVEAFFNNGITFTGNTICSNATYNLKLLHQNNADLSNNCWCSDDSAYIRSTIYDGYQNIAYGLVDFLPFATSCSTATGLEDLAENSSAASAAFPNPFSNTIEFRTEGNKASTVQIFDMTGRSILQRAFTNSILLDTEALSSGVYFYRLQSANGISKTGKLLKE